MGITINEVKTSLGITNTYDIVNAIRNSNPAFANYVPLANAENVAEVGQGILINQTTQNDFITSLVDRIGLVVIRYVSLNNPLKKFKKGAMPQGLTIEEIFTDITKAKKYDAEDAEQTVFKREIPNVHTLFHKRNRQDFYEQTIQDDSLKSAFISWGHFEGFISSIINAIYNSAEVDEYEYMKLLVDNYHSKGMFKVVPVNTTGATGLQDFVKKARATSTKMTLPMGSRDFNALAVRTRTDVSDLHLLIDADLNAAMDVDVLAKAFNMDKTDFMGNVTIVDGFSSEGLRAVLVDKDFFMVYDNLLKLETIRNPKGLYWNYFYHVWQTLSVSRFSNAVAFVDEAQVKPVTQVIVSPSIANVKPTQEYQFEAIVRTTDDKVYTPVWAVTKLDGTADSNVSISDDGLFKASALTGDYKVTATVTYDTDKTVVGEAIITVR